MFNRIRIVYASLLLATILLVAGQSVAIADGVTWRVSKSSGDVWIATAGVRQVALTDESVLNPGDSVRTGRNGRVLLVRGDERILVSPNSVIGLPPAKVPGTTTVIQQSGSILLDVEKRSEKHFEVETPYLAAVVRGTQFRVTVGRDESYVNVSKGQVEVTDFRSGQSAMVMPGQMAKVWALGVPGLSLSGSGALGTIRHGSPRTSSVTLIDTPIEGLTAPGATVPGQEIRAARPRGDFDAHLTQFGGTAFNDSVWDGAARYWNRLIGRGETASSYRESDLVMMSIPLAFGGVIAAAVAVRRRRQKHKQR